MASANGWNKTSTLGFKTAGEWTTNELADLLSDVTSIYNMHILMKDENGPFGEAVRRVSPYWDEFDSSVNIRYLLKKAQNKIPEKERLKIHKIKMGSPGSIIFKGDPDATAKTKETIKDSLNITQADNFRLSFSVSDAGMEHLGPEFKKLIAKSMSPAMTRIADLARKKKIDKVVDTMDSV